MMSIFRNSGIPDHPRACGANKAIGSLFHCSGGSSPRVRGKRREPPRRRGLRRIIPARAGQTRTRSRRHGTDTDHPRACGANLGVAGFAALPAGSSPRVRGKRRHVAADFTAPRIIPARAGQTWRTLLAICSPSDHPRACGANFPDGEIVRLNIGSSPRVRGKPTCLTVGPSNRRIIPARAGQTSRRSHPVRTCPDHPRACGANPISVALPSALLGSSPRVRGKLRVLFCPVVWVRIIPARAGQTRTLQVPCHHSPDHPRACGANRSKNL